MKYCRKENSLEIIGGIKDKGLKDKFKKNTA